MPIKSAKKRRSERKEEPSDEAKRTAESMIEWLEKSPEEEKPPVSQTSGKSERDIHGANCDCESCESLRKAYGRPRRIGRFPGGAPLKKPRQSSLPQGSAKGGKRKKSKNKRRRRRQREQGRRALNYCAKHPNVQTALACGKCGRFICPRCITHTPLGMRCADCAAGRTFASRRGGRKGLVAVILVILVALSVAMYLFIINDDSRGDTGDNPTAVMETQTPSLTPSPTPMPIVEQGSNANRLSQDEITELREYALGLINADRTKHGVAPVVLGNNPAAQMHAEDMLEHDYQGHWWLDGRKPYMVYSATGGTSYVAENAASWGWTEAEWRSDNCGSFLVRCNVPSPELAVKEHQWGMMYDDAHADWGHRDNILDEGHRQVNIGVAFNNRRVTFIQHFEGGDVEADFRPTLSSDGILSLTLSKKRDGVSIAEIVSIYYDPQPISMTPSQIDALDSYCVGGGATTRCGDSILDVLEPPPPGWYYNLDANEVVADLWEEGDDSFQEIASLGSLVAKPGVYTVVVWKDSGTDWLSETLLELSVERT